MMPKKFKQAFEFKQSFDWFRALIDIKLRDFKTRSYKGKPKIQKRKNPALGWVGFAVFHLFFSATPVFPAIVVDYSLNRVSRLNFSRKNRCIFVFYYDALFTGLCSEWLYSATATIELFCWNKCITLKTTWC